jgi:hypothetical protein
MSEVQTSAGARAPGERRAGWRERWLKEDWRAIWLGLGIVLVADILYANGGGIRWIAVTPPKWTSVAELGAHFGANWLRYAAQFAMWAVLFAPR